MELIGDPVVTKLDQFIRPNGRYRRSVNLEQELASSTSLNGYIPTAKALEVLRRIADAVTESATPRAWSITGPYGSGKSSLAHFLLTLLGPGNSAGFQSARRILRDADPELAEAISRGRRQLGANRSGFIRGVATAQREPVMATILRALLRGTRDFWSGPGRRPTVVKSLGELVSAGERGRMPTGDELVRILNDVSQWAPVVLVLDEMGKNLEFAADHRAEGDLFVLQQIAEAASGDGGVRVHMLTLQHLAFEEYAGGMSTTQLREWAKVQGRFEEIPFTESSDQLIEVISRVFEVSEPPRGFVTRLREWVRAASHDMRALGLDGVFPGGADLLHRSYPLHPLSLVVLPELCARYGQHDRSLFAFLTGPEPHAVGWFLGRTDLTEGRLPTVGLAQLYDYFIESLGATVGVGSEASRWLEIQRTLREAGELTQLELQCLKAVGVLNLVSQREGYRASKALLEFALVGPRGSPRELQAVHRALRELERKGLLVYRAFAKEYRIWRGSDFDVDSAIRRARERAAGTSLTDQLSQVHLLQPLVARRHTQEYGTVRYFEGRYVEDLDSTMELRCHDDTADGLLLYVIGDPLTSQEWPSHTTDGRPVIVVRTPDSALLQEAALEAAGTIAVLKSETALETDRVARQEVYHRVVLAQHELRRRLAEAFRPQREDVEWYALGRPVDIRQPVDLSRLLSDLCDQVYSRTPTLPNEMVNRRELTSQGAKARRELIEAMILRAGEERLGFTGYGPERSMYEAILSNTGLHQQGEDGVYRYGKPKRNSRLGGVWRATNAFFDAAEHQPRPLDQLYRDLMSPPIGMKEGPIPVLLTVALLYRSEDVAIYQDGTFLPVLSPDLMERLIKSPDRFWVRRFETEGHMGTILERLGKALSAKPVVHLNWRNASLLAVVKPLINVVRNLEPFSVRTRRVSQLSQRIRAALSSTREPDALIFEALPEACGFKPFVARNSVGEEEIRRFCNVVAEGVSELQNAYPELLRQLAGFFIQVLGVKGSEAAMREDLRARSRHLMGQVIDPSLRAFLLMAVNEDLEDQEWLEALAMNLTQKPPRAWLDEDLSRFENNLIELGTRFRRVELLHFEALERPVNGFEARRITLTTPEGGEVGQVVWVDTSRTEAVEAIVAEMLERAESIGEATGEALLAALAERILGDPASRQPTQEREDRTTEGVAHG
jgi:hypothetical protein